MGKPAARGFTRFRDLSPALYTRLKWILKEDDEKVTIEERIEKLQIRKEEQRHCCQEPTFEARRIIKRRMWSVLHIQRDWGVMKQASADF